MQLTILIAVSFLSGGLAGACISVAFNRISRWRELRTKFYPALNNMFSAYVIRVQEPEGRYLSIVVGYECAPEDETFIDHRSSFLSDLVQYNELKEVRTLRKKMLDNSISGHHETGKPKIVDLSPELDALKACVARLHKKLKM